jgi:hypothetical protein
MFEVGTLPIRAGLKVEVMISGEQAWDIEKMSTPM